MEAKTNLKGRLPSRHVTERPERAPHLSYCYAAGEQVLELAKLDLRPRMIVTRNVLENAATVVAASGGSTNAALHLPAIAHECEIAFDLFDVAEVFKRTPYIADLKPAGRFVAKDLFEAGGVPMLMKTLLDSGFVHGECMTVAGYTMAENLKCVAWNSDQEGIRPADPPEVQLSDAEFEKRRAAWQPRGPVFGSGYPWKYAQQVGSARHGAVTHPGGAAEKACYADI